jgi:hypothetical protein
MMRGIMAKRITGPRARYRGKVRKPVVLTFTPEGHSALAEGTQRTGLSKADYIESLLRKAAAGARRREAGASA